MRNSEADDVLDVVRAPCAEDGADVEALLTSNSGELDAVLDLVRASSAEANKELDFQTQGW